jgi:hypothetical protein
MKAIMNMKVIMKVMINMKVKTSITLIPAFAFCLMLFSGCEAFLDTVPDNRTELDSNEKIARLLVSAYPQANYASYANAMADDVTCRAGTTTATNTSNQYILNEDAYYWRESRVPTHSDSPTGFWNSCYQAIATANHALEAIDASPNPDALRYQRSEALLCRAFSHFLLVTFFAKPYLPGEANDALGIPYADKPETEVLATYERKTVQYVYERIEEDITEALKNLPPEADFKVPAYHFTTKAALTFASRFYLYKGDFERVVALATQIVPMPVRTEVFGNVPVDDPANTWAATYFAAFKSWGTSSGDIRREWRLSASKHNFLLAETYSLLNRSLTCQYGTVQGTLPSSSTTNITGGYWPFTVYNPSNFKGCFYIYKFEEYFYSTSSSGGSPYVMFPFIRAEEVLLNRIEAEIHLERFDAAINDLNVYYRQRSGESSQPASLYSEGSMVLNMPKIKNGFAASLTSNFLTEYNAYSASTWSEDKLAMMLFLLETRRSEYVHEGVRWFDVLRFKIPAHHKFMDGSEDHLMPNDPRRQWQIPEAAVNFGLEPNER